VAGCYSHNMALGKPIYEGKGKQTSLRKVTLYESLFSQIPQ